MENRNIYGGTCANCGKSCCRVEILNDPESGECVECGEVTEVPEGTPVVGKMDVPEPLVRLSPSEEAHEAIMKAANVLYENGQNFIGVVTVDGREAGEYCIGYTARNIQAVIRAMQNSPELAMMLSAAVDEFKSVNAKDNSCPQCNAGAYNGLRCYDCGYNIN